ncbi:MULTISPECIES: DUF3574 domain-containing protein [unclassified Variovorax]|jgi:hypothetical protein|uniref:DUF3574 domain-containing protein n=1 Tax=unclassified Variovorax TaxID=663243 RepID=UPI000F7EB7E1|nr:MULTISPECIES: DUF3574 domain-containing protein [unclassified Variovorax]RSZ30440.1 DUF3574 domain-containing protein [Variovorax sp. 553]RSZ30977.1 DUF3574 domain-containing protein [Variovorax sp. 679]
MKTTAIPSLARTALAAALAAVALAGCGSLPSSAAGGAKACASGFETYERDTLFFGRAIPTGGQVSDTEWTAFLDATVTPAFPQGLTVIDAAGQWRGVSGDVVRERSKLVVLLHPRSEKDDAAIATIVGTYRQRFAQEAVLQERQAVCVRF